jgi:parallel beta-helix repeat protein
VLKSSSRTFLGRRKSRVKWLRLAYPLALFIMLATACGSGKAESNGGLLGARHTLVTCTKYAALGSRNGTGTIRRPYASVQTLVDSLRPGETGCLKPGVYRESVNIRRGGTRTKRLTVTSTPGPRATILGSLFVAQSARYVTIADLHLNGKSRPRVPSPQVNGSFVTFRGVDITNEHTGTCLIVGGSADTYGTPSHLTVTESRIHDCGRLPPNHLEHGIYLERSRHARIVDNYIYDNADWGLHLYPDAQNSVIAFNVIDGNGSGLILGGTGERASSGNTITHNVFSNAADRRGKSVSGNNYGYNVTSFWGSRVGKNNSVSDNCFWNGAAGDLNAVNGGFSTDRNVIADPRFVSRADKDFRLRGGGRCIGAGPRTT